MRALLVALAAVVAAMAMGCAQADRPAAAQADRTDRTEGPGTAPTPRVDRFDADRAFALLRRQVRIGPRPAGSAPSRRLAAILRRQLPNGRFEPVPPAGGARGMRNVVGHLPARGDGRGERAIVIGAHYDTKDIPGFVGANDGAAGTAVVVELSRSLRALPAPADRPEIRFVLFDGEESPRGSQDFLADGLRGSRAYLRAHRREIGEVIVVDFVGDRDLSLPREAGSDPRLWGELRAAARRVGVIAVFPPGVRGEILDDHTPFARAGIPAIDLIDFDYPFFHTVEDTLDKVSARSLDAVGESLVELIRTR